MAIMFFFLSLVLFLFLFFMTPLFYSLFLIAFSSLGVLALVTTSKLSGFIGLLILLIYLGAMIILLGYVCAVTPNLVYESFSFSFRSVLLSVGFLISLALNFFVFSSSFESYSSFSPVSYFYTYLGSVSFIVVIILMLLVLYGCTTTTQVSSPFRSS